MTIRDLIDALEECAMQLQDGDDAIVVLPDGSIVTHVEPSPTPDEGFDNDEVVLFP